MVKRRLRQGRSLRVLQSFREPGPGTNPYIMQLRDSLTAADVVVRPFSWRVALIGGYDVFHAHWPEALIERRGFLSTIGRQALYTTFLLRLWLQRVPIVSTVHNIDPPRDIGWVERLLLAWTQHLTRVRIVLNAFTPVPTGSKTVLIEHGHYCDWFSGMPHAARDDRRMLFFGNVRRYKNVSGLLRAFSEVPLDATPRELRIVGRPSSDRLGSSLRKQAQRDSRVSIAFEYVDDSRLVEEVTSAALIVLPYPEMHNSGSVLAALSLARPVLVPDNQFNRSLADEVGGEWVIRYEGELNAEALETAMGQASTLSGGQQPDLSRRDWARTGKSHLEAYLLAAQ